MGKTKYPNQIDTPSELPIVRDNIYEIGSDAINSLRSAIIQIEKVLGINPQGASGLTVGQRISQSLDSSGNIKTEALTRAGIVYGPITNDQIASDAAINESKLKLNFPTFVLQSEISSISLLIKTLQFQVDEIAARLSSHLSTSALNRHKALSISTDLIDSTGSSIAIKGLDSSNAQDVFDSIFSSHINYTGQNISVSNNSHTANQIFFDNSNLSYITASNVQDAIEEASEISSGIVNEHQRNLHSNGFLKYSEIYDSTYSEYGTIVAYDSTASIEKNTGNKPYFAISLDSPISTASYSIGIGDIVNISYNDVETEYQIYQIIRDSFGSSIAGFNLFGTFPYDLTNISIKVYLKKFKSYNNIGILSNNREQYGLSSSNIIQILNSDAPFIISKDINPNEITASNRYFGVKIDGNIYNFDVYNSSITKQSIDSIIKLINETCDYSNIPILAYRVNLYNQKSEIVIAHNISSLDDDSVSLEVVRSDDSIDSLGFSYLENKIIYGQPGSSYYIDGNKYNGLLKKLDVFDLTTTLGSRVIGSGSTGLNFLNLNIKTGDILHIFADKIYAYEISSITEFEISLSARQLPVGLNISTDSNTRFIVYESSIISNNLEFLNVTPTTGSSLLEVFLDKDRRVNLNLILEQQAISYLSKSCYSIVDFYNPSELTSVNINFENTDDNCVNVWLDNSSDVKKIVGDFNYIELRSNINNFKCLIYIENKANLYNFCFGLGIVTKTLYPSEKINKNNNLIISNAFYSNFLGKFDAGINGSLFLNKINFGALEEKDISTALLNKLSIQPISDLRSSGVIFGLEITSVSIVGGTYLVNIDSGTAYVSGKRFEIESITNYNTGLSSLSYDKIFIGIDHYGNFVFSPPDPNCEYPWYEENILLLGSLEYNGVSTQIIDQRLFVDNLDYKILNSILVSNDPRMGHFTDIRKAIKYAKRFSQIFKNSGTPAIKIKSGEYKISYSNSTSLSYEDWRLEITSGVANSTKTNFYNKIIAEGVFIDFPITIIGEGSTTSIDISCIISASDGDRTIGGALFIAGSEFNTGGVLATENHDQFSDGRILIQNLTIKNCGIVIADPVNYIPFSTENLLFSIILDKIDFHWDGTKQYEDDDQNISYKNILAIGLSNTTNDMGNISITSCSFFDNGNIVFYPASAPSLFKHIYVGNNQTTSTSGITTPSFTDLLIFPSSNEVWAIGNASCATPTKYDRISSDLVIGGNLTVGGSISGISTATATDLSSESIYATDLTIANSFVSLGSATLSGPSIFSGTTTFSNTATFSGSVTHNSNLTVNANINIGTSTRFNGDIIPPTTSSSYIGSLFVPWEEINSLRYIGKCSVLTGINAAGTIPDGVALAVGALAPTTSLITIKQLQDEIGSAYAGIAPAIRIYRSGTSTDYWDMFHDSDNNIQFAYNGVGKGYLQDTVGTDSPINFTGQHRCNVSDDQSISSFKEKVGLIVVSTGEYLNTSGEKIKPTINESLPKVILSSQKNQKNVFGVISGSEEISDTTRKYKFGTFVSIAPKNASEEDTRLIINSIGEGGIWVCNFNGNLENGDYISSSDITGLGMKQDDDILRSYTVAKITQDCNFELNSKSYDCIEFEYGNKTYRKAFVGCTYHCG